MSDTQDDLIRERAYAIWQAEGSPEGRHDEHWQQAATELTQAQDESAQRDEPVLSTPQIDAATGAAPSAAPADAAPAPAPTPTRRGRKTADAAPATPVLPKGRRKKGD